MYRHKHARIDPSRKYLQNASWISNGLVLSSSPRQSLLVTQRVHEQDLAILRHAWDVLPWLGSHQ